MPNRWDGHLLLLPPLTAVRAAAAAWARRGLDLGEKLIYAADAENPTTDSVLSSLTKHGADAADAAAERQLAVVESERFCSADAYDRLVTEAFAQDYPGLWLRGEVDTANDTVLVAG